MKILCSTYWYPEYKGDTQAIYVHDINRHLLLISKENDVIVVTPNYGKSAAMEEMDGVKVERFKFGVPLEFSYGRVAQTKKSLLMKLYGIVLIGSYVIKNLYYTYITAKKYDVHVIHAHWAIPSGFPALIAAKLLRKPCFITMHGGDVYYNKEQGYIFPKIWYVRPFLKYALTNVTSLTAITEDCKKHAINAGAKPDNVVIINNGADVRRFSAKNNNGVFKIKKQYQLERKKVIFTCRQLIPRKGIRFLIKAMPLVLEKHPNVKLLVAGDGMERLSLEKLIDGLMLNENVILLGWIQNDLLPDYYNAADISVIPSLEEGFGIPAAEAMGCELPVVATDAGGLVEVVKDGISGLIVPKADEKALAEAIIKLLDNPDKALTMGKAGREVVEKEFTWDKTAEKFLNLFKKHLNYHNP
jgi:glycosyltransferase involved in cell wall biosynthesis